VVHATGNQNARGIAALIYTMTIAVLFGAGLITVLLLPGLSSRLMIWIPVVVVASIIVAEPVAWFDRSAPTCSLVA
jgi:hypothetical protein